MDYDPSRLTDIIQGIFLLLLGMYAAYITQATGCQMQQWLSETVIPRHFLIFMIIFFAIDFTQQSNGSPLRSLLESGIIYVLFLLFSRTPLAFSIAGFGLLCITYILSRFIHYEREKKEKNQQPPNSPPSSAVKAMGIAQLVLVSLTALIILVGFVVYLRKQLRDHADEWSTVDFIFGKPMCAHQMIGATGPPGSLKDAPSSS